jgi:hypothetical protein
VDRVPSANTAESFSSRLVLEVKKPCVTSIPVWPQNGEEKEAGRENPNYEIHGRRIAEVEAKLGCIVGRKERMNRRRMRTRLKSLSFLPTPNYSTSQIYQNGSYLRKRPTWVGTKRILEGAIFTPMLPATPSF